LEVLQRQEPTSFAAVITGDESRIFRDDSINRGWRPGDKSVQKQISKMIDTEKHILIISLVDFRSDD
jgi:hypothetical protein